MPSSPTVATTVLVRTTELNAQVRSLADVLEQASGHQVAYVVDERSQPTAQDGREIVRLSRERCQAIGLYCPPGFAWSCGDYGYYLACRMLPHEQFFWLIEHDVRFSRLEAADFFAFFAPRAEVDLLASYLTDADSDWYWARTTIARKLRARRCFFPVTRLSVRAVNVLYDKRTRHSRRWSRRALWPNDEAMVATTLADAGLVCRDINGFGRRFYSDETFSYANLINGDTFDWPNGPTCLHHPVLHGEHYADKQRQLAAAIVKESSFGMPRARWAARINRFSTW